MKYIKIAAAVATLGLIAAQSASAATTNTINFNGTVVGTTCVVDSATQNVVATLPNLAVANFGAFAGFVPPLVTTQFSITLDNCPSGIAVHPYISATGSNWIAAQTAISNSAPAATAATGVGVQIAQAGLLSPFPLDLSKDALANQGTTVPQNATSPVGSATFTFNANYIQTAATVTAGKVLAAATYTIVYN